jgi:hypothetical protein
MQGHDFLEDCLVKCRDDYSHAILTGHNHPSEALSMEFRKKCQALLWNPEGNLSRTLPDWAWKKVILICWRDKLALVEILPP